MTTKSNPRRQSQVPDVARHCQDKKDLQRCEELLRRLAIETTNWRAWPRHGRCEAAVRATATLLAAVDAAPLGAQVEFQPYERQQDEGAERLAEEDRADCLLRLLGPALGQGGAPNTLSFNTALQLETWGLFQGWRPGQVGPAMDPDLVLKWAGAAHYMALSLGEAGYKELGAVHRLFCRLGSILLHRSTRHSLAARLRKLGSPLTVEALGHVVHQHMLLASRALYQHPEEPQPQFLAEEALGSVRDLLMLRPASLRTLVLAAEGLLGTGNPEMVLELALDRARWPVGTHGGSEPYHQALLCCVCARAMCEGGAGPSVPADLVLEVLGRAKECKEGYRSWLPRALRRVARRYAVLPYDEPTLLSRTAQEGWLPAPPPAELKAAERSSTLGAADGSSNAGAGRLSHARASLACSSSRMRVKHVQQAQEVETEPAALLCSSSCSSSSAEYAYCAWCHSMVLEGEAKICGTCRAVVFCSCECQKKHWREGGHCTECAGMAEDAVALTPPRNSSSKLGLDAPPTSPLLGTPRTPPPRTPWASSGSSSSHGGSLPDSPVSLKAQPRGPLRG